jgi:DNA invertase Pin-like site-specific DNA recombinase
VVDVDDGFYVRFADLPQIEGTAGRFMLKQMALVAEFEAGFISDRTKAALAAAKHRGKKLGGFRAGAKLTRRPARRALRPTQRGPQLRAHRVQASGAASLRAIASALNGRGIPTASGGECTRCREKIAGRRVRPTPGGVPG